MQSTVAQSYCVDQSYNPCVYQNTKVACGRPYRQQAVSCLSDCMRLCDADYNCAGADFVNQGYSQVCMLYHGPILALNRAQRVPPAQCGYQPAHLIQCQGHVHYCKHCNGAATTSTRATTTSTIYLPPGAQCSSAQDTRYVLIEGVRLSDPNGVSFGSNSVQQCLQACTDNRLPSGQQAVCQSIDYRAGTCTLNEDTLRPEGTRTPQPFAGGSFYEKVCVSDNGDRRCPGPYLLDTQHVLVGFAITVVDAQSFEQCMQQCVDSRQLFDFDCRSGLFFYEDSAGNCILNYETRDTQPDLYQEVPTSEGGVDYFEPRCQNDQPMSPTFEGFVASSAGASIVVNNEVGALSASDEWGSWGACNQAANEQTRYRRCRHNRINQCEDTDTRQCPLKIERTFVQDAVQHQRSVPQQDSPVFKTTSKCDVMVDCCPMVDSTGVKDCKQGMKLLKFRNFEQIRCVPDAEHC